MLGKLDKSREIEISVANPLLILNNRITEEPTHIIYQKANVIPNTPHTEASR